MNFYVSICNLIFFLFQMFREQRIDGAGLPLLTEDHLTGLLRMKLGPALKLRALLSSRLGSCAHCRTAPPAPASAAPGPWKSPAPASPVPKSERPSSANSEESQSMESRTIQYIQHFVNLGRVLISFSFFFVFYIIFLVFLQFAMWTTFLILLNISIIIFLSIGKICFKVAESIDPVALNGQIYKYLIF